MTVGQLLDGERWRITPDGDGFVLERPPLLSPAEMRRWKMLDHVEAVAQRQAAENAARRK